MTPADRVLLILDIITLTWRAVTKEFLKENFWSQQQILRMTPWMRIQTWDTDSGAPLVDKYL